MANFGHFYTFGKEVLSVADIAHFVHFFPIGPMWVYAHIEI